MKIGELMTVNPLTVKSDQTVLQVSQLFLEQEINEAPVLDDQEKLVGMITQSHLLKTIVNGLPVTTQVQELMATDCEIIDPDDDVRDGAKSTHTPLFVVKDDKLLGMVSQSQVLQAFQQLMAEARNELEAIGNSMYNPLISVDENGYIKTFNKSMEKVLGLKTDEIRGRNINEIFDNTRLMEVIETGLTQSTQKLVVGSKTFLSNRTPVIRNEKIVGAVAVLQDISELEEISKELAYSKRLNHELDAIIESSFDGLYVTDGQGYTLRLNKGFERITGVSAEECVGRNMEELVEKGVYSRSGTLLALERKERVTITLDTRTGKTVLVTSNPILDNQGNIILVVTNVRDITELNELQRKLDQMENLSRFYQTELQQLKLQTSRQMVVRSPKMKELVKLVIRLAGVDSTILIQGESGVGKEFISDIIHAHSNRKEGPMIKVNCGAIPENLLESELFGYNPGAFTGAHKDGKAGLFELADGGTLLLDEIGELPLSLQVKLLRVLQDREITRVGGTSPIKVDIRVLAGTNRDLAEMIINKEFREDLYYRLNVVPIIVPPLRERKEDIPALARHFLEMFNQKYHMDKHLAAEVLNSFLEYDWPGNVRELENLMERLVVTTLDNVITVGDLPLGFQRPQEKSKPEEIIPLRCAVENAERNLLQTAFSRFDSTYQVAEALEVNQSTIVRKAAKYGIKSRYSQ